MQRQESSLLVNYVLTGCPIQELWKHLEKRRPSFPLPLDENTKQFLWKGITKFHDVDFFALPEPFPHIFGNSHEEGSEDKDVNPEQKSSLDQVSKYIKFCIVSSHGIYLQQHSWAGIVFVFTFLISE